MLTRLAYTAAPHTLTGRPAALSDQGCQWWNFACQGSTQVVDAGLSVITRSTASGAAMVLGQIVKIVDESTQVPLADPGYRHIYYGFLGLAAPLIGVILCVALVFSALRRDPATLGRALVGVGVAGLGGAFYIGFAQLLVALDNWLSHGIVKVTGQDLAQAINQLAAGFENVAGLQGDLAANMLLILLMMVMLLAGIILWFVLVLRKMAILVVVAFAPLLIAGYLWAPTRSWVTKVTEVLIALVFTKSAIFGLFGIGLALLSRGTAQSLSDFVGTVVLLCGACFTPLLMLRLVHFAGDTHLAGDMMGTLRGGMQPVLDHVPNPLGHSASGRHDLARQQAQSPLPSSVEPARATSIDTSPTSAGPASGSTAATGAGTSGGAGASATTGAAAAAGPVGVAVAGRAMAAEKAAGAVANGARQLADAGERTLDGAPSDGPVARGPAQDGPDDPPPNNPVDRGDS
jgi:type IV secretion system protein TrbL